MDKNKGVPQKSEGKTISLRAASKNIIDAHEEHKEMTLRERKAAKSKIDSQYLTRYSAIQVEQEPGNQADKNEEDLR